MARIQSGSNTFTVAAQKTVEATQKLLVKVAKREHNRVLRTAPRPVSFTRFVDGRKGAAEETVRADGTILYTYPRLELVAQYAMEVLHDLSPVRSGRYRDSHTIFLNGSPVANLKAFKSGDEVSISNMVPYARKIEVGRMVMRVPNNVYKRAAAKVRARYGNIASITMTFRGFIDGTSVNPIGAAATARSRNSAGRFTSSGNARPYNNPSLRYPVLIISER